MSIEVSNKTGCLGQFASNAGYTDLIEASQKNTLLKKFFLDANTEDVPAVISALKNLDADSDVLETASALIDLIEGQKLVFITNGTHDGSDTASVGKGYGDDAYNSDPADENAPGESAESDDEDEDASKFDFEMEGSISKVDKIHHLVFGWFSIVTIGGKPVEDTQGDIISPETIEFSAYDFVLNARKAGEMHRTGGNGAIRGIGRLVESCVFTAEKQAAMLQSLHDQGIEAEIDLKCIAWWGGFFVEDPSTWSKIESSELKAFSIGGKGKRAAL